MLFLEKLFNNSTKAIILLFITNIVIAKYYGVTRVTGMSIYLDLSSIISEYFNLLIKSEKTA